MISEKIIPYGYCNITTISCLIKSSTVSILLCRLFSLGVLFGFCIILTKSALIPGVSTDSPLRLEKNSVSLCEMRLSYALGKHLHIMENFSCCFCIVRSVCSSESIKKNGADCFTEILLLTVG